MGWAEVLAGAAGGGVVSLLASAAIAERAERGRQRAAARREVRQVVGAFAQQVTLSDLRRGAGPADDLRALESQRHELLAREVVDAMEDLSRLRRWRIRRALVSLVGPLPVRMAQDLPAADPAAHTMRASLWFMANADVVEEQTRRPGVIEQARQAPRSDQAWKAVATAVRRLLRAV